MKILVGGKRCVIQSFELDDNIFSIDDRAEMLYLNMGIEFEDGVRYEDFKYYFMSRDIRFSVTREKEDEEIQTFISENIMMIIRKVLLLDSEDNRVSKLKLNDMVMIKKSLVIARVTGVYLSQDFYELDNDLERDYLRDELIKWGDEVKEERENVNYRELKLFNISLDKVEYLAHTVYEVVKESHNGDEESSSKFRVVGHGYREAYERALALFNDCIGRAGG